MKKTIAVIGATGNLGGKIIDALLAKGAEVRAVVRLETDTQKINILEQKGVKVFQVDTSKKSEISKYLIGADCVVFGIGRFERNDCRWPKSGVRCGR
jgi:uncharacterized protein YbjT (DUF2867 family)